MTLSSEIPICKENSGISNKMLMYSESNPEIMDLTLEENDFGAAHFSQGWKYTTEVQDLLRENETKDDRLVKTV